MGKLNSIFNLMGSKLDQIPKDKTALKLDQKKYVLKLKLRTDDEVKTSRVSAYAYLIP